MAGCNVFLELDQAQLEVIARVFGTARTLVQPTAPHRTVPVLLYGMFPPGKEPGGVHPLYAVEVPGKPGEVRIHLTDVQKAELQCAGIKPCDYIEVEPIGPKYGIVFPPVTKYGMPVPPATPPAK